MNEMRRLELSVSVRGKDVPPVVVGEGKDVGSEPANAVKFRLGCAVWHHHGAAHSAPPRRPCNTRGHVSRACGVDARRELGRAEKGHSVIGSTNLERADWLEVLQLQVEVAGADSINFDQRRTWHRIPDAIAGGNYIVERDRVGFAKRFHPLSTTSGHSGRFRSSRFMILPLGLTGIWSRGTNRIRFGTL